ncbi:MAG: hypothetical protein A2Z83_08785 [Omnitrophica bacterium GWA2_52_8]|nr:MAG: hypothetical protein A2Z83_08785 [Omnitrophica bacterium GWA2_52_8]
MNKKSWLTIGMLTLLVAVSAAVPAVFACGGEHGEKPRPQSKLPPNPKADTGRRRDPEQKNPDSSFV